MRVQLMYLVHTLTIYFANLHIITYFNKQIFVMINVTKMIDNLCMFDVARTPLMDRAGILEGIQTLTLHGFEVPSHALLNEGQAPQAPYN